MGGLIDRRSVLLAAGTLGAAVMGCSAVAQSGNIEGTIVFSGGQAIPPGRLTITVEDPGAPDSARIRARAELNRPAKSDSARFSLPVPQARLSPRAEIVVQLQRDDGGMLLARGTAGYTPGKAVEVTLYPVIY